MPRPKGSANVRTLDFIQHFDALCKEFDTDPVRVLMHIMTKGRKVGFRLQAASTLMQYRYPKLAAAQLQVDTPSQLQLKWDDEGITLEARPGAETLEQIQQLSDGVSDARELPKL